MAATSWNQIAWSFGGEIWDSKTFTIDGILQSDANIAALELAIKLIKQGTPDSASTDFGKIIDDICNGKAAMGSLWSTFMPCIADPNCCAMSDLIAYSVVPGQTQHSLTLGGMGLHINAQLDPERIKAATAFLEWFSAQTQQREWVRRGGYSARKSVLASGTFINSASYAPVLAVSYPLVKDFWNIPEYSQLLEIQMRYLGLAFNESISPATALERTAKEQQAILDLKYPDGPPLPINMQQVELVEGVVIALLTLVGVLLVVSMFLACWIWYHRDMKIYRFSSTIFLVLILVGAMLTMGGLLTYSVLTPNAVSCNFHLWFTVMGVVLMMAPMLAKTWRLVRIFQGTQAFKKVHISNSAVLGWASVVAAPVVILLIAWTSVSTNEPTRTNDIETKQYTITCSNSHLEIYLGILFGYLGFLGVMAAIASFYVRKVSNRVGEAKYIALIIYNSILISAIILPLIFYLSDNPTISFGLEVGGLLVFTATFIGLLFGPKLYLHYTGHGDGQELRASLSGSHKRKGSSSGNQTSRGDCVT